MSVKGYYDFDVTVAGTDASGTVVSEFRKVRFNMIDLVRSGLNPPEKSKIAEEGAIELVRKAHPTWKDLTVTSCIEV